MKLIFCTGVAKLSTPPGPHSSLIHPLCDSAHGDRAKGAVLISCGTEPLFGPAEKRPASVLSRALQDASAATA